MEHFLELLFSNAYGTIIFSYLCLLILPCVFARLSQPNIFYGTLKIKGAFFLLAFIIICLGLAFADNGTDTNWYMNFFEMRAQYSDCEYGAVELGFQYYNVLIHYITDNPVIFIIITRCIMIVCVFAAVYLLRDKTIIWLAILSFAAVVYFQMFSALRNGLAYSMGFLVYAYCVKNKYVPALAFAVLGVAVHRSMLMFVVPLALFSSAMKLAPKIFKKIAIPVLLLSMVVVYFYGMSLIKYFLMSDDVLMGKYDGYLDENTKQGFMIFIVYFPMICLFLDYKYLKQLNSNLFYLNLFLTVVGFAFALLAYQIGQLARIAPFYACPFIFYIGYYLQNAYRDRHLPIRSLKLYSTFMIVYWFYRFSTFISGLFFNNGLDSYSFFNI